MFVAGCLPAAVRGELGRWARSALGPGGGGGVRRVDQQAMHLTLCFLGDQPLGSADELAGALGAVAEAVAAVGVLAVGTPVLLPPRRPRALAVQIGDPSGALAGLRGALVAEIGSAIGWEAGPQRFLPHVTLARLRAGAVGPTVLVPTPALRFELDGVALFRSYLEPDGARYEELASVGRW